MADGRAVMRFLEIGRAALFQFARLADVERLPLRTDHAVHARQARQSGEQGLRVEGRRDRNAPVLFGSERFAWGSHRARRRKVASTAYCSGCNGRYRKTSSPGGFVIE